MAKAVKLLVPLLVLAGALWLLLRDEHRPLTALPVAGQGVPATAASAVIPSDPPRGAESMPAVRAPAETRPDADPAVTESGGAVRVRVLLVDDETRDPVPHLATELRSAGETLERIESDERGLLLGTSPHPLGAYRLDLSSERAKNDLIQTRRKEEAQAFPAEVELVLEAKSEALAPREIAVPVGPTLRFVAAWPGGFAPESFTVQLAAADPRQAFDKLFARVRPGSPPWARFSPLTRFLAGGPPWGVRVTSEDGLWLAVATIEALDKRTLAPVPLDFSPRARIVGRVLATDDAPVVRNWVQAWLPDSSFQDPARRPVLVLTDANGRFDLRALKPGMYTLKVEADGFEPLAEQVEAPALMRVEHDLRLEKPDKSLLGSIRGRITSRSGTYAGSVEVNIRSNAPPHAGRRLQVEWKDVGGARQAAFEFSNLAPGTYTLSIGSEDLVRIEPRRQDVQPAPDVREITIDDSGERVDVVVRVVAHEDGSPLPGFRVSATVKGSDVRAVARAKKGETEVKLAGAPVGATLELTVDAQSDRRIVWQEVLVTRPPAPVVVRLEKGWAAEITVRGPAEEPLSGVKVLFDDLPAGTTDAAGVLRAAVAARPITCRFEYRDWVLAPGGDVLPETGKFRTDLPWVGVSLRPPK